MNTQSHMTCTRTLRLNGKENTFPQMSILLSTILRPVLWSRSRLEVSYRCLLYFDVGCWRYNFLDRFRKFKTLLYVSLHELIIFYSSPPLTILYQYRHHCIAVAPSLLSACCTTSPETLPIRLFNMSPTWWKKLGSWMPSSRSPISSCLSGTHAYVTQKGFSSNNAISCAIQSYARGQRQLWVLVVFDKSNAARQSAM